jgi:hypothetical protein
MTKATVVVQHRRPLVGWQLRESTARPLVVPHGSYGLPLVHRAGCQTGPSPANPRINESALRALWRGEHIRLLCGLHRTIDFCSKCAIQERDETDDKDERGKDG